MRHALRRASESSVKTASRIKQDVFNAGYEHAMKGGQLDKVEYFRMSFREGYRAAKLHLRALRKQQGIVSFPVQGRVKFKVA